MSELTPLQLDAIRVALQFHAAIIQQTLAALNSAPQPQEAANGE
jgi:hypothetical protein